MRVKRALHRQFAPDSDESLFYRSLDIRMAEIALGAGRFRVRDWMIDRGLFLLRAFALKRKLAGRSIELRSGRVWAYDPGSASPTVRAYRQTFMERCLSVTALFAGGDEPHVVGATEGSARIASEARAMAWRAVFDFSSCRWRWLADAYQDLCLLAPLDGQAEELYVFQLSYARPYLVASWLAAHTSIGVRLVMPGVPLFRDNRFNHMTVPVMLTSRAQEPEIDYYRQRGWVCATSVRYAGPEFALDLLDVPRAAPAVHIGFFSSGEWARVGGLIQSPDVDAVARGAYADNPLAQRAELIVSTLADFCRDRGLTLRLYPHPYERMLMSLHGITPPYGGLADGTDVTLDVGEGSSRSRIYEPLVAVSVQSSFIWERLDLGLDLSFIHSFEDEQMDVVLAESLGEYQRNVFKTPEELFEKIEAALADSQAVIM